MAVLHPNLSIDKTTAPAALPDTGLTGHGLTAHGHITTTYHRLRDCFGQPDRRFTPHRNTGVWVLHTPAGRANLRRWSGIPDSAGDRDVESRWLILAATDDVLPWIYKVVLHSTAAFPTGARTHFSESTLEGFGNAYLDYLYLRMRAETERRVHLDRAAPGFGARLHRPQQLNNMLLRLAHVLNHYEWAHSSETERAEWSRMQRPSSGEGLRYWKACNRWLYPATHQGNPDLPGMLRALADAVREDREPLLERFPDRDFVLYDEHEQTLRALADTPIPGLDSLSLPRR